MFGARIHKPILVCIAAARMIDVNVNTRILNRTRLDARAGACHEPFDAIVSKVAIRVIVIIEIIMSMDRFRMQDRDLIFTMNRNVAYVCARFVARTIMELAIGFRIITRLMIVAELRRAEGTTMEDRMADVARFRIMANFRARTPDIKINTAIGMDAITRNYERIIIRIEMARTAVGGSIIHRIDEEMSMNDLTILVRLAEAIVRIAFDRTYDHASSPLDIIAIGFNVGASRSTIGVLVVISNTIITIRIAARMTCPYTTIVDRTVAEINRADAGNILFRIPSVNIHEQSTRHRIDMINRLRLLRGGNIATLFDLVNMYARIDFIDDERNHITIFIISMSRLITIMIDSEADADDIISAGFMIANYDYGVIAIIVGFILADFSEDDIIIVTIAIGNRIAVEIRYSWTVAMI